MIEQSMAALLTDAGVTSPFRPRRVQGEDTVILYRKVSGADVHVMDGPSGLLMERWQLDVWADTYAEARQVANAVIAALNGAKGLVEGVDIRAIIQIDDSSDYVPIDDGSDRRQHLVSLDFTVAYRSGS